MSRSKWMVRTEYLQDLITETVITLCKSNLTKETSFRIDGTIGITLSTDQVILINMNKDILSNETCNESNKNKNTNKQNPTKRKARNSNSSHHSSLDATIVNKRFKLSNSKDGEHDKSISESNNKVELLKIDKKFKEIINVISNPVSLNCSNSTNTISDDGNSQESEDKCCDEDFDNNQDSYNDDFYNADNDVIENSKNWEVIEASNCGKSSTKSDICQTKKTIIICPEIVDLATENKLHTAVKNSEDFIAPQTYEKYLKQWISCINYCGLQNNEIPNEEHFINYFQHLRKDNDYRGNSLWAAFTQLNYMFRKLFGKKLQEYTGITSLLKSYQKSDSVKKANIFTTYEIYKYLTNENYNTTWHLSRKTAVIFCYYGGLRTAELREINRENILKTARGYAVAFTKKNEKVNFLIPKNVNNKSPYSIVAKYLTVVDASVINYVSGPLFLTPKTNKYINQPIGINLLYKIGKEVAEILQLPKHHLYTGHTFCKSSISPLTDEGATDFKMRKYFD